MNGWLYHRTCFFRKPPLDYDLKVFGIAKEFDGGFCYACEDRIEEGQEVVAVTEDSTIEQLMTEK